MTVQTVSPAAIDSSTPSRGSLHPDTLAVHAGGGPDPHTGAVTTPIHQTTTFAQERIGGEPAWCYTRTGNPTRHALESALAALERARHGISFASGIAAANAVLQSLAAGDHVVAARDLYGGCHRLFTRIVRPLGVEITFVDTTRVDDVRAAIRPDTSLLWLETPSNPLLHVTDVAACAAVARERGVRTLVDGTFATPVHLQPLELGADLVLHSTTKYIGGHCDVLGGAVITSDDELADRLRFIQNGAGAVPGPQDCFLLLRGLRTLPLRMERHAQNALAVATALESHSAVSRVLYPGLPSHPQHALAARQGTGFGGVVSLEIAEGSRAVADAVVRRLRLFELAESLGGVRSLVCHPATMTHAAVEPAIRRRIGIGDGLLRLSIGVEHSQDLIDDLDAALRAGVGEAVRT